MGRMFLALAILASAVVSACGHERTGASGAATTGSAATAPPPAVEGRPALERSIAAPDTGDGWVRPARDYSSARYSPLADITSASVGGLVVKGTLATGIAKGHEAAPLVVGDTMYVVTPYPNDVYALDLTSPGLPVKWKFSPAPLPASQGVACCDVVNRGAAYADGLVVFNTLDVRTIAVDAATGRKRWETKLGEIANGETMTMAPLIVKDKVLVGNSGGEMGVRGWLTALDLASGAIAWRAWSTGPDRDVLIGARFKPFYDVDRGRDLGVHSWPGEAWKTGGGAPWGWISYDPALDLVYYGTSNAGPWNADQRPGDNKWTAAIVARDPDDGEAVWAYQTSPHDLWDYDGVNELILLDLPIGGTTRHVLVRPDRNGYVYVIDRATGEVLSADPFVHITSTLGVDLRTGRPRENPQKKPAVGIVTREVCPAAPGGKDWQPSAWSPRTGLLYLPANNLCMDMEPLEANYIAGTPFVGANARMYAGPGGHRGELMAWDPIARKKVWSIPEKYPVWSGVVATGGDLVFYGTMDRWFKAVDARTGQVRWQFRMPSGVIGQPITYRGPDGRQYVAVFAGVGGWPGVVVTQQIDTADATAALGFANAVADLPHDTPPGGTLVVFGLP